MILPTEKTKPIKTFADELTMIYGDPKVGKSTFCSGFDSPLFLDSEGGLRHLSTYNISISCWDDVIEAYKALAAAKKAGELPYKTLVFDTINNFYTYCMEAVCKEAKINHPSDLDYGKGWNMVRVPFTNAMNAFRNLGLGVIYVAHATGKTIKSRTKGEYTRFDADLAGQPYGILMGKCDFILYACIESEGKEERRILRTKPCEYWNAGDRTGKLPPEIPLNTKGFLEAYDIATKEDK